MKTIRERGLFALAIVALALFAGCGSSSSGGSGGGLVLRAAYPGADDCKACHATEYDKWVQSGHGYKMNVVDPTGASFPIYPFSSIAAMLGKVVSFNLGDFDSELYIHAARDNTNTGFIIGGFGWKARFIDETGQIVHGADAQYNLVDGSFSAYHDKTDTTANGDTDTAFANYNCGYCHTTDWKHTSDGGAPNNQTVTTGFANIDGEFQYAAITCQRCHGTLATPSDTVGGIGHNTKTMAADTFAPAQNDGNAVGAIGFGALATASNNICSDCHNRGADPYIVEVSGKLIRHHEQSNSLIAGRHGNPTGTDATLDCMTCHDPHASTKYDLWGAGEGVLSSVIVNGDCTISCHSTKTVDTANYGNSHTCVDCHMPYVSKTAKAFTTGAEAVPGVTALGTPSGTRGDLRTHVFALDTAADATQFDAHLDSTGGQVKLAVDFSCMTCHGTNGTEGPTTAAEAAAALGANAVHP